MSGRKVADALNSGKSVIRGSLLIGADLGRKNLGTDAPMPDLLSALHDLLAADPVLETELTNRLLDAERAADPTEQLARVLAESWSQWDMVAQPFYLRLARAAIDAGWTHQGDTP